MSLISKSGLSVFTRAFRSDLVRFFIYFSFTFFVSRHFKHIFNPCSVGYFYHFKCLPLLENINLTAAVHDVFPFCTY